MPDTNDASHPSAQISWDCGEASLQSLGGMLGPVTFRLPDGQMVRPLHVAPWENEDLSDQPQILRRLRGEWPCVPFGMQPDLTLPPRWQMPATSQPDVAGQYPHGFGSNHHWAIGTADAFTLTAEIDYPETSAIAHLGRRICATPGKAELTFEISITARRDCQLPIGIHPVFALPGKPGSMRLDPGQYTSAWSHPLDETPALSIVPTDTIFGDLSRLPGRDGKTVDALQLPYASPSETLLLLTGASGKASLANITESYVTELEWDPEIFPSLMLWISNRGRTAAPWSSRHLAIGIEPVRAAFDLGESISVSENPLRKSGVPTAWTFAAGECLTTRYTIRTMATGA